MTIEGLHKYQQFEPGGTSSPERMNRIENEFWKGLGEERRSLDLAALAFAGETSSMEPCGKSGGSCYRNSDANGGVKASLKQMTTASDKIEKDVFGVLSAIAKNGGEAFTLDLCNVPDALMDYERMREVATPLFGDSKDPDMQYQLAYFQVKMGHKIGLLQERDTSVSREAISQHYNYPLTPQEHASRQFSAEVSNPYTQ